MINLINIQRGILEKIPWVTNTLFIKLSLVHNQPQTPCLNLGNNTFYNFIDNEATFIKDFINFLQAHRL